MCLIHSHPFISRLKIFQILELHLNFLKWIFKLFSTLLFIQSLEVSREFASEGMPSLIKRKCMGGFLFQYVKL